MAVSYKRLFHLMIDIEKICYALDCGVDDILEFIPEEKEHTTDD